MVMRALEQSYGYFWAWHLYSRVITLRLIAVLLIIPTHASKLTPLYLSVCMWHVCIWSSKYPFQSHNLKTKIMYRKCCPLITALEETLNLYFSHELYLPDDFKTGRTRWNRGNWYLISISTPCEIVHLIKFAWRSELMCGKPKMQVLIKWRFISVK